MVEVAAKNNFIMTSMLSKEFFIDIKIGGVSEIQLSK